jgi:uncharacterized protein (DUF2225 family)
MILNKDTPEAAQWCVYDCAGTQIPYVVSFDTETCEIEIGVYAGNTLLKYTVEGEQQPIYLTFVLSGAYAKKKTEEEIKRVMEDIEKEQAKLDQIKKD